MAAQGSVTVRDTEQLIFDIRTLLRLSLWGGGAIAAAILAVIFAFAHAGSRQNLPSIAAAPRESIQSSASSVEAKSARQTDTENELRSLAESVRTLAADREQLLARLASLERNLQDVTGAIQRDAAAKAEPVLPSVEPPSPSATVAAALAREEGEAPAAQPDRTPVRETSPTAASAPSTIAAARPLPPIEPTRTIAEPAAPRPELGIDIGGAINFTGLRALWNSTRNNNLLDNLRPLVLARENTRTRNVDLRLIVGPITDFEAAARLCAALAEAHRYCQPVAFEGQTLSLTEPTTTGHATTGSVRAAAPERRSGRSSSGN
jgi:hypothetical protein